MRSTSKEKEFLKKDLYQDYHNIPLIDKIFIVLFPYFTFFGQYISIIGINISNVFSIMLFIYIMRGLMKRRFYYIKYHIGFYFIVILFSFLSLIWTPFYENGLVVFFSIFTGFIAMAFIASLTEEMALLFFNHLKYFTYLVILIAIFEIFTGQYLFFNNESFMFRTNQYGFNYPGVAFTNPNDLAQYLVGIMPIFIISKFEKGKVIVASILVASTLLIIINTESRLALIIFLMIFMMYLLFFSNFNTSKFFKIGIFFIFAALLILFLMLMGVDFQSFDLIDDYLKIDISMDYFLIRNDLYKQVFQLGLNDFLKGSGLGSSYTVTQIGAHNLLLFFFADLGGGIAIAFILNIFLLFFNILKSKGKKIYGFNFTEILLCILITFPLISIMSSVNEQRKSVWIILGLFILGINGYRQMKSKINIQNN